MSDYEDEEQLADYSQLLNKKKKGKALKRGVKPNATNDIVDDQLQMAMQGLFQCISHKEKPAKNISLGHLNGNYVTISQNKGGHSHTMGFSNKGVITFYLEEAAFLTARNALIVYDKSEKVLEFEDFCEMICEESDSWITYDKYQVYAYLKRLGFIVMRSKGDISNPTRINYFNRPNISRRLPVWDYLYKDYSSIYSTLQIIPSSPWYKPFYKTLCRTFDWDVYKPRATWKKKDPGIPDFKVVVENVHNPILSLYHQNQLFYQSQGEAYKNGLKDTRLVEFGPTFLVALVGDAEGVTFLRMIGDGLADISSKSFGIEKRAWT